MLRRAPKILLSYRRADTGATAGRLADHLKRRFGAGNVFIDVDNIPYGRDFRDHIHQTIANCDVVIALIGPSWTGAGGGHRRIDDAEDHLRIEIETAFETGTAVIPVLTDFARMPASTELPPSISKLAFINAAPLSSGRDFEIHTQRISDAAQVLISPQKTQNELVWYFKSNILDFVSLLLIQNGMLFISMLMAGPFIDNVLKKFFGFRCRDFGCSMTAIGITVLSTLFLLTTICAVIFYKYSSKKIDPFVYGIALLLFIIIAFKIQLGVNIFEFETGTVMIAASIVVFNIPSLLIASKNQMVMRFL